MTSRFQFLFLVFSCALSISAQTQEPNSASPAAQSPFEFFDGDRVVLLGDTLIEREQLHGFLEARILTRYPERNILFRNLGWSADTVFGQSRVSFDWHKPEDEWFKRLLAHVAAVDPTVVVLGYGMAHSFDGEAGIPKFKAGLTRLIEGIRQLSPDRSVRVILLSPIRHENLGAPLPDPTRHNEQLAQYTEAIRQVAQEQNCRFISLFDRLSNESGDARATPLTDNGIHLNAHGYSRLSEVIARELGWSHEPSDRAPSSELAEHLRKLIVRKNELYFHRWRPQNETYLFGFRKHEQGQNAREIPMFDPLVAAEEKRISELARAISRAQDSAEARLALSQVLDATAPVPAETSGAIPKSSDSSDATVPSRPKFEVAEGFEVELFAESPALAKPIQINFDPQGRLWIASSSVYPQIEPGQVANDKILVLEDTDRDGKADKSTVFAEGLLIPTGVEPGDGGAYVGQSTDLLHFKDVDGDGKADQKRIVLSGFGTEDTHHIVHTLRWGHDGQLYFNQSIYIHTHTETPHGVVRLNSGGILHLRPSTLELGVFCKGWVNSWGHDFDAFGQSFVTDGAGGQGINYGIPGAMYVTYAGARRILGSVSPGSYPKFCGLEIVASEHFPSDWQGDMITCDFRAHRIVRFSITEQGSAYVTQQKPDLLRTSDVTFRPIDVKFGPDGALYVADWSNPIIQHGEVDFRDPRRDHQQGRIWRITAKGRPLLPERDFVNARTPELLDQLLSPTAFNRRQARRVLTERGESIRSDLAQWTAKQTTDTARLEALWTYQSVNLLEPQLLSQLLSSSDGRIRAAAVRVTSFWLDRLNDPQNLLARAIADEHPRVRLEAMRALSRIPTARSAELVLSALEQPMDSFLDYGTWLTINDLAKPWADAVRSGAWKVEGRERQLEFALEAIEPHHAAPVLAHLLKTRELPRDGSGPWIELIGKAGAGSELRRLFDLTIEGALDESAAPRALVALREASRLRKIKPDGDLGALDKLIESTNDQIRAEALRLAGQWKLQSLAPKVVAQAEHAQSATVRDAAFEGIREMGGAVAVSGLRKLLDPAHSAAVRRRAAETLAALDLKANVASILDVAAAITEESESIQLWRSLLSNRGAARAITQALTPGSFPAAVAKAGMRAAREAGRNEPELIVALARSGDLEDEARQLTPAEVKELVDTILTRGDAGRGELVYRRAELGCVACHAIGGVGGKVGPDLTSVGASAPPDYLVEAILYPNRKVKEGYHSLLIETDDGQEFSGILVQETNEQILLRDAANREISIAKKDIVNRLIGGSIMPSGLIDNLNPDAQIDLYRFLVELGKAGPFDASKGNVARSWKLIAATIDLAQFGDERILGTAWNDSAWSPASSFVDGRLPKQALEEKLKSIASRDPSSVYAATQFQAAAPGRVTFQLSGSPYTALWIDGRPLDPASGLGADLAAGIHTVVVKLDAKRLPEFLRLEANDVTFLTQ